MLTEKCFGDEMLKRCRVGCGLGAAALSRIHHLKICILPARLNMHTQTEIHRQRSTDRAHFPHFHEKPQVFLFLNGKVDTTALNRKI